jgi:hypothetical protein
VVKDEENIFFLILFYMRSKIRTRKHRGGMNDEVSPPYSPPRGSPPPAAALGPAPPAYRFATSEERNPSQLTQDQWSALEGRARDITFEIRQPTKIVFNSRFPENNMAKVKLGFPMVALPSLTPLIPKIGDKVVAVNKANSSIKYLLVTLKIKTPESQDLAALQPFFLKLNSSNFDIVVINEQRGGNKTRKTSKGKTQKRKGGKKKGKKSKTKRK